MGIPLTSAPSLGLQFVLIKVRLSVFVISMPPSPPQQCTVQSLLQASGIERSFPLYNPTHRLEILPLEWQAKNTGLQPLSPKLILGLSFHTRGDKPTLATMPLPITPFISKGVTPREAGAVLISLSRVEGQRFC